ncbi:MAG: RdgB/HAM1 family non-canonical purine NTP pyrophosphatase [Actinomycetota bacterium]|nr:RdgB/HAM1 family non-canonical purine NTP pyrophosphatase [Actinomycetota bacterium]
MSNRILLASRNRKKLAELRRILGPRLPQVEIVGLDDVAPYDEVPETGATFSDNALLKAHEGFARTGVPTIAEDSGLAVDALNGMPGVLSARWSGRHGDDVANLQLVLAQVADTPDDRLSAAFVSAAAYVDESGQRVVEGRMPGRLVRAPRGDNGFGYDPIFVAVGHDLTNGELAPEQKDAISHRGQALRALADHLANTVRPTEGSPS